ncbi:hypothetical protein Taro_053903 [Colocasia esculenta]|uniref:Uncharacterized protein n=1 Tax=Colocasia esculenta TaxID=4460 RepID=A0A843XNX3_COLES|nr:hypothetical protein [Colocasia esculenta]
MASSKGTNHQVSQIPSSQGSTNASNVPTSSKIRKSLGKFKGLETFKKIRAYNNAKLPVQIDMEFRRPFGENADGLVGEIARLVTLCASFDVSYWRDVPEDRKDKIYEKLLDKFELKVGDEVCNDIYIRKIIYEIAGRRYRDVRCTLYHHYQSYATDEERLQNPPQDINANEWAWLAMSERNKVNRSKQETVKDKLEELASQSCDSPVASIPEEVLSSVVGQRFGHIRGRGCGPRPPSKSVATAATITGLQSQVKDKEERMIQMEEIISKQREDLDKIQEKLDRQHEEMSSQLNEMVNKKFMDMIWDLDIGLDVYSKNLSYGIKFVRITYSDNIHYK